MPDTLTAKSLDIRDDMTLGEVNSLVVAELERLGLFNELDYFNADFQLGKDVQLKDILPNHFNWTAVWAVPGGSEGHYIHVELVGEAQDHADRMAGRKLSRCIFLGKTFMGMDAALEVVKALTVMLSD